MSCGNARGAFSCAPASHRYCLKARSSKRNKVYFAFQRSFALDSDENQRLEHGLGRIRTALAQALHASEKIAVQARLRRVHFPRRARRGAVVERVPENPSCGRNRGELCGKEKKKAQGELAFFCANHREGKGAARR